MPVLISTTTNSYFLHGGERFRSALKDINVHTVAAVQTLENYIDVSNQTQIIINRKGNEPKKVLYGPFR